MKIYFISYILRSAKYYILFISLITVQTPFINAQESYLRNTEIESTTKFDENNTDLPTNPFEIVNMIRKAQSMNDATDPTDAIDDALKSFYKTENKEGL